MTSTSKLTSAAFTSRNSGSSKLNYKERSMFVSIEEALFFSRLEFYFKSSAISVNQIIVLVSYMRRRSTRNLTSGIITYSICDRMEKLDLKFS